MCENVVYDELSCLVDLCWKEQDGAPLSELMSFISNYFTMFSSYPTAKSHNHRTAD